MQYLAFSHFAADAIDINDRRREKRDPFSSSSSYNALSLLDWILVLFNWSKSCWLLMVVVVVVHDFVSLLMILVVGGETP